MAVAVAVAGDADGLQVLASEALIATRLNNRDQLLLLLRQDIATGFDERGLNAEYLFAKREVKKLEEKKCFSILANMA